MGKVRLHWFWRAVISVLVGALADFCLYLFALAFLRRIAGAATTIKVAASIALILLAFQVPPIIIYGLLSRRFGLLPPDGELHCRRCDHILRGLSEPRCPECGEAI